MMDKCAICGQDEDQHFMDFVDGIPLVGSYDAKGAPQRCSALHCTCATYHHRSCPCYKMPVVFCGVSTEGANWAMESK